MESKDENFILIQFSFSVLTISNFILIFGRVFVLFVYFIFLYKLFYFYYGV